MNYLPGPDDLGPRRWGFYQRKPDLDLRIPLRRPQSPAELRGIIERSDPSLRAHILLDEAIFVTEWRLAKLGLSPNLIDGYNPMPGATS